MGVRRDKAALSSGCKPHPAIRSSRKQPEQAWRRRNGVFAVLGGLGGVVLVATVIRLGETNRQRVRLDIAGMAGPTLFSESVSMKISTVSSLA